MSEARKPLLDALHQAAADLRRADLKREDALCAAWLAETGLMPSESVLCTSRSFEGESIITRVWVEKRK